MENHQIYNFKENLQFWRNERNFPQARHYSVFAFPFIGGDWVANKIEVFIKNVLSDY